MDTMIYRRTGYEEKTVMENGINKNVEYSEGDMLRKLEGQTVITLNEEGACVTAEVIAGALVKNK